MFASHSRIAIVHLAFLSFACAQPYAYVANFSSGDVAVIDTATDTVTRRIAVAAGLWGAALSTDETRLYVTSRLNGNLYAIDLATFQVTHVRVTGGEPHNVKVAPDNQTVWVGNFASGTVSVFSSADLSRRVITVPYAADIAFSNDGRKAYVTSILSHRVYVIDAASLAVLKQIAVGNNPQTLSTRPDGAEVWVANQASKTISIINTATDEVAATLTSMDVVAIGFSPDGTRAYAIGNADQKAEVFDTATRRSLTNTGIGPYGVSIGATADGKKVYAVSAGGGTVASIDAASWTVSRFIAVGTEPRMMAVSRRLPTSCAVPADSLTAWWTADGTFAGATGALTGTISGNVSFAAGKVGQAFRLEGDSAHIRVPDSPLLWFGAGDFTWEAWVNASPMQPRFPQILSKRSTEQDGFLFGLWENGRPYVQLAGVNLSAATSADLRDTAWHHVAAVRQSGVLTYYVDGQPQGSVNAGGFNLDSRHDLWIGRDEPASASTRFHGSIDEVGLYRRALSPQEIQRIVEAGAAGKCRAGCNAAPPPAVWLTGDGHGLESMAGRFSASIGARSFAPGKADKAFRFDGNSSVRAADAAILNFGSGDFTFEAWIQAAPTQPAYPQILSKRSTEFDGYLFGLWSSGRLFLQIAGVNIPAASGPDLRDGAWHHVAGVRRSGMITYYVDGEAQGSYAAAQAATSNHPLWIGRDEPVAPATGFNGSIDEVAIHARALSAPELTAIVRAGATGRCKAPLPRLVPTSLVFDSLTPSTALVTADAALQFSASLSREDNASPLPFGGAIRFTAGSLGTIAAASVDADGKARSSFLLRSGALPAGRHTLLATFQENAVDGFIFAGTGPESRSFDVLRAAQSIEFAALEHREYTPEAVLLAAAATSGLPVGFTAAGACSVSGAQLTMLGAGTCTVTAQQPGDENYEPASDVVRSFVIARATTVAELLMPPMPPIIGEKVLFRLRIRAAYGLAVGGAVDLINSATGFRLGTAAVGAVEPDGYIALGYTFTIGGTYTVYASYSGSATAMPAVSNTIQISLPIPTPTGGQVSTTAVVNLSTIATTFASVTASGTTSVVPITPTSAGPLPGGFLLSDRSVAFEISTTAKYTSPVTTCFQLPNEPASAFQPPYPLRVLHGERQSNGAYAYFDRTVLPSDAYAPDSTNKRICARTATLSPFVVAQTVDTQSPLLSVRAPAPAPAGTSVVISATADDSTTGGSAVTGAEYRVDQGEWIALPVSAQSVRELSFSLGPYTSGVRDVCVRVSDASQNAATACVLLPVYDPAAGFVTGGGWITSPPGAYALSPSSAGRAVFGFVSKYQQGATVPAGNTQFQFVAADLRFRSESYDWLVVAGARAQYKGSGTINGRGAYGFMLTAVDGALAGNGSFDKFRIKIWDLATSAVVYDNQAGKSDSGDDGTLLDGVQGAGSVVIQR